MRVVGTNKGNSSVGCLVLHYLPVVMWGGDVGRVEQVDESGVVIDIRVGEEAMSPSRNLQVSIKPGIVLYHVHPVNYPLDSQVPGVVLQVLPIPIVEGLELWSNVHEVVGGILHHIVNEGGVW